MKAAVIANGNKCAFDPSQYGRIICADGALAWALQQGLPVDTVVGDMDSVDRTLLSRVPEQVLLPHEKDETDTQRAIETAAEAADEIDLYGALGGRLDHLLANVSLLLRFFRRGVSLRLIDETGIAYAAAGRIEIDGKRGQLISLFPADGPVRIISTSGLYYEVIQRELTAERPYFISNIFTGSRAEIETDGEVLVVLPCETEDIG